jgi:hypothetical protein
LAGRTPAQIAKTLKVSQGAIYKVLRAAQIDYYDRQALAVRKALAIADERYGLA